MTGAGKAPGYGIMLLMSRQRVRVLMRTAAAAALILLLSAGVPADDAPRLHLATWNIRILSDGSRDDSELAQIASILARYDFVAIQELRDTTVLDRLMLHLPAWEYVASDPVGRGVTKRYAFVYRTDLVSAVAAPHFFPDQEDLFIREPYVGHFRSGEFDFSIISIHVLYGNSVSDRRAEIALLDDVIRWVDEANGEESDVLLVGDFNLDAADHGWEMEGWAALVPPDTRTTISDRGSYDNIWYNPEATTEILLGTYQVFRFDEVLFGNDDRAASLAVSDHRPVSVAFSTAGPDDDGSTPSGIWDTGSQESAP